MAERKKRVKRCEFCTPSIKKIIDCHTCEQEAIMKAKIEKVMHEFKEHMLHSHSSHGSVVKERKQALAIALSEGRKAAKIKKPLKKM